MALENDLFELIKSLSKAEKKHFRLALTKGSSSKSSNYLLLFDQLTKMETYSLEVLKQRTTPIKNLPATMTQLSELLLKDLSSIGSLQTVKQKLHFLLSCIEITRDKGLFRFQKKLMQKAERIAKKHEQFSVLLQLNQYRRGSSYLLSEKNPIETLAPLLDEDQYYQEQLRWEAEYTHLLESFKAHRRRWSHFRSPEQGAILNSFRQHALINGPCKGKSFLCRVTYEEIRAKLSIAASNIPIAQTHFQNISNLWQSAPHRLPDHTAWFLDQYYGLILTMMWLVDPEGVQKGLAELRTFKIREKGFYAKQQANLLSLELIFLINFGTLEAGMAHIKRVTDWIKKHPKQISASRQIDLYVNCTLFCFLNGEFSAANNHLRQLTPLSKEGVRDQVLDFARLMEMIVHYELGNQDILNSLFRSTYRYFRERDRLYPYEQSILNFMRRVDGITDRQEIMMAMKELRDSIEIVLKNNPGRKQVGSQELFFWLDARISGIPIRQYYEDRVRTR